MRSAKNALFFFQTPAKFSFFSIFGPFLSFLLVIWQSSTGFSFRAPGCLKTGNYSKKTGFFGRPLVGKIIHKNKKKFNHLPLFVLPTKKFKVSVYFFYNCGNVPLIFRNRYLKNRKMAFSGTFFLYLVNQNL